MVANLKCITHFANDNDNSFSSEDSGPAMYYSTTNVEASHEFLIKVKHSSGVGSTISLDGFMIVEGSETVYVNGVLQTKKQLNVIIMENLWQ